MASARYLESLPAFPDGLPEAKIPTVSLLKLSQQDGAEAEKILGACRDLGFFQLDLRGDTIGEQMSEELDRIFDLIHEIMSVSDEEKLKFKSNSPHSFHGLVYHFAIDGGASTVYPVVFTSPTNGDVDRYKMQGFMKTETGQPDRCTFFTLYQDDLLGNSPARAAPDAVEEQRALLTSYVKHGQYALAHVLASLERQLSLPADTLRNLQRPERTSGTTLRMIRYAPSLRPDEMRTGLLPHTDFGAVTLLANALGGLQVLSPGHAPADERAWRWVRPQAGCLIVNMGDAMVEWTGGVLRSNMHRVNHAPGRQRLVERLSVALLVRASAGVSMARIVGGDIPTVEDDERDGLLDAGIGVAGMTAAEWEVRKADALNKGRDIAQSRGGRPIRTVAAM